MINDTQEENDEVFQKLVIKVGVLAGRLYDLMISHLKILIIVSLVISITFSILKTLLYNGYNVDSYQYFALSIKEYFLTGQRSYLFDNYYARTRMLYPLIIAILHFIFPIEISILACIINLVFAVLSLIIIRKILKKLSYNEKVIDLFTVLAIMSYNLLNYWFNVLTDFVGLFFFLLFVLFLIRFKTSKNFFDLAFSFTFYIYSILVRELFVISLILYIFLIPSKRAKLIVLGVIFSIILVLVLTIPEKIPFMDYFIASTYWDYYLNGQLFQLFFALQQKWLNFHYVQSFFKGLFKVGIIPSIVLLLARKKRIKRLFKLQVQGKNTIIFSWFIIFFIFFMFLYSNLSSASGLRYWLPISWIPLIYISNDIIKNKKSKFWDLIMLFFLILFPIAWSSGEWYVNRYNPSGTGSPFSSGEYNNEMTNLRSITILDSTYINITLLDNNYFSTVVKPEAFEPDSLVHQRARMLFDVWMNITEKITIEIRLKSPNNAYWGLGLYSVRDDYAPGLGDLKYSIQYQNATEDFMIYKLEITTIFLLRFVSLSVGGSVDSEVVWDYIRIKVN